MIVDYLFPFLHLKCLRREETQIEIMMNRILIQIVGIILIQLMDKTQAECRWESSLESTCAMTCASGYSFSGTETIASVMIGLEQTYQEVNFIDNSSRYSIFIFPISFPQ